MLRQHRLERRILALPRFPCLRLAVVASYVYLLLSVTDLLGIYLWLSLSLSLSSFSLFPACVCWQSLSARKKQQRGLLGVKVLDPPALDP